MGARVGRRGLLGRVPHLRGHRRGGGTGTDHGHLRRLSCSARRMALGCLRLGWQRLGVPRDGRAGRLNRTPPPPAPGYPADRWLLGPQGNGALPQRRGSIKEALPWRHLSRRRSRFWSTRPRTSCGRRWPGCPTPARPSSATTPSKHASPPGRRARASSSATTRRRCRRRRCPGRTTVRFSGARTPTSPART